MSRISDPRPHLTDDLQVVGLLGKGGMGVVVEVVSARTQAHYAAKTILKETSERARARFRREAELLARCDRHPGVVKVHALGETSDGKMYLLLDLVRGESLEALLERERRLEPERAATLVRDVARALDFVHAQGIIHRDLKPANVLLDSDAGGAPRVTDFGLATADDVERLTRTGEFVGTISYCSPEQIDGRDVGVTSDVFSLGAILFRALAGEAPFDGESALSTIAHLTASEPAPDVRSLTPDLPEPLALIVARALEKDPERRYATARELEADLGRFLAGERVLAQRRRSRDFLRIPLLVLLVLGASLVAVALVGKIRQRQAAAHEVAGAEESVAEARRDLARAMDSPGVAAITSSAERAVAEARAAAERALAQADEGGREGASGAAAARDAATSALSDVTLLEATMQLALGCPERAQDRLAGAGQSCLARLLRARVLVALGHPAEARVAVESVLAEPGATTPTAVEWAADVLAATGDPARAQKLYTTILPQSGRRAPEIQAKRGGAAFEAGAEKDALADLLHTIPDPGSLPDSRAENARLAPLAPVLYSRGLSREDERGERDLDGAWRLADPPRALAEKVGLRWLQDSLDGKGNSSLFANDSLKVANARHRLELAHRMSIVAPDATWQGRMDHEGALILLGYQAPDGKPLLDFANALEPAWPDNPARLFLVARARSMIRPEDPKIGPILDLAIERLPDRSDFNVKQLAQELVKLSIASAQARAAEGSVDLAHLEHAANIWGERLGFRDVALFASALHRSDVVRRCLEALGKVDEPETPEDRLRSDNALLDRLGGDGLLEEALTLGRASDADLHSPGSLTILGRALILNKRWDELVALLRSRPPEHPFLLEAVDALKSAGHAADADELSKPR